MIIFKFTEQRKVMSSTRRIHSTCRMRRTKKLTKKKKNMADTRKRPLQNWMLNNKERASTLKETISVCSPSVCVRTTHSSSRLEMKSWPSQTSLTSTDTNITPVDFCHHGQ